MKSTTLTFVLLAMAATGSSHLVEAAVPGPEASTIVVTRDLDLDSAAGQVALRQRLARAAAEVCGEPSASDPAGKRAIRACRRKVVAGAEAEFAARHASGRLAAR